MKKFFPSIIMFAFGALLFMGFLKGNIDYLRIAEGNAMVAAILSTCLEYVLPVGLMAGAIVYGFSEQLK